MKDEKRTQSKFSEFRKSGGTKTKRECDGCGIITRSIWLYKNKFYCYICYKKRLNKIIGERKKMTDEDLK